MDQASGNDHNEGKLPGQLLHQLQPQEVYVKDEPYEAHPNGPQTVL